MEPAQGVIPSGPFRSTQREQGSAPTRDPRALSLCRGRARAVYMLGFFWLADPDLLLMGRHILALG